MSVKQKYAIGFAVGFGLIFALYQLYPLILFHVLEWQKSFNSQLSAALRTIHDNPQQAGVSLLLISFLYGVFHAVGPGHGKFILTSYLSLEQTKLPQTLKITWLSAIVQGLVAVGLVTLLVVGLTLSRHYFNLTLKWVERGSFMVMMAFGAYWIWQAVKSYLQKKVRNQPLVIRQIRPISAMSPATSGHIHTENCSCGHKHLPSSHDMAQIHDWKSMWAVVFSIGLRPCTGAILVLFLSYTLDLYLWGVASALVMAIGTGLTLSLFACLVMFARNKAVQASRFYLSLQTSKQLVFALKLLMGLLLLGVGSTLLHSSFIEVSGGLFKR
ncbi:cobalt transporter [Pasteurellaceae bacterium Orientalotternb1]|nr:cobalt transporter [Pasteurellaceae bacterium Orientalotternb1]